MLKTFHNWRGKAAGAVGVLVVLPSLINAVSDIWTAWQGLPIGEKEKANSTLFKAHFKESPLITKQIIIDGSVGRVPLTFDVYTNGDIFVDYGRFVQWFPYVAPNAYALRADWSFISPAYSESVVEPKMGTETVDVGTVESTEVSSIEANKGEVIQVREFTDGSQEIKLIEVNTGMVKQVEVVERPEEGPDVTVEMEGRNLETEVIILPEVVVPETVAPKGSEWLRLP